MCSKRHLRAAGSELGYLDWANYEQADVKTTHPMPFFKEKYLNYNGLFKGVLFNRID